MLNYILEYNVRDCRSMVPYLMKQPDAVVTGQLPFAKAFDLLTKNGVEVRQSDEFEGYPLTSDDIYFFAGKVLDEPAEPKPKTRRKTTKG